MGWAEIGRITKEMTELAFAAYAFLAVLQVTAGTAAGSAGRTEVPDPMQIEVSLGADVDIKGNPREPFNQQPLGKARAYPETDRFVCDQARVRMLTVKRVAETPTEVVIEASPTLISEWPLQDVDLTVALVGKDGQRFQLAVNLKVLLDESDGAGQDVGRCGRRETLQSAVSNAVVLASRQE